MWSNKVPPHRYPPVKCPPPGECPPVGWSITGVTQAKGPVKVDLQQNTSQASGPLQVPSSRVSHLQGCTMTPNRWFSRFQLFSIRLSSAEFPLTGAFHAEHLLPMQKQHPPPSFQLSGVNAGQTTTCQHYKLSVMIVSCCQWCNC